MFQKKEIKQNEKLKSTLGKDLHRSWTGKLEYLGDDKETSEDNNIIRLKAPSRFIGETIKDRYFYNIKKAFEGVGIKNAEIVMEIPDKSMLRVVAS